MKRANSLTAGLVLEVDMTRAESIRMPWKNSVAALGRTICLRMWIRPRPTAGSAFSRSATSNRRGWCRLRHRVSGDTPDKHPWSGRAEPEHIASAALRDGDLPTAGAASRRSGYGMSPQGRKTGSAHSRGDRCGGLQFL